MTSELVTVFNETTTTVELEAPKPLRLPLELIYQIAGHCLEYNFEKLQSIPHSWTTYLHEAVSLAFVHPAILAHMKPFVFSHVHAHRHAMADFSILTNRNPANSLYLLLRCFAFNAASKEKIASFAAGGWINDQGERIQEAYDSVRLISGREVDRTFWHFEKVGETLGEEIGYFDLRRKSRTLDNTS